MVPDSAAGITRPRSAGVHEEELPGPLYRDCTGGHTYQFCGDSSVGSNRVDRADRTAQCSWDRQASGASSFGWQIQQ
jgi:hypothetical protein